MSQNSFPSLNDVSAASTVNETEFANGAYHLRISVGLAEFDCEGPAELVRQDYREFLDLIDRIGSKAIEGRSKNSQFDMPAIGTDAEIVDPSDSDAELAAWDRVYMRKDDKLSLNMIPDSQSPNSESILLLIYGYQKLFNNVEGVSSVVLMEAAKQSGLRIDRIDRNVTAEHNRLLLKGGSGKGSRYSLNNRGLAYVEELLDRMFE